MQNNHIGVTNAITKGYHFSTRSALKKAWDIVKNNMGLYVGYAILFVFLRMLLYFIPFLGSIALLAVSPALIIGWAIATNLELKQKSYGFDAFFKGFEKWVPLFIASLIIALVGLGALIMLGLFVVLIGNSFFDKGTMMTPTGVTSIVFFVFVLLILVFIFMMSIMWIPYLIHFYDYEPREAITTSYQLVKKNFTSHVKFMIAMIGIFLLGVFTFGLGIFIAIPVIYVAQYLVFLQITGSERKENVEVLNHFSPLEDV